jgi:hypothetical protein
VDARGVVVRISFSPMFSYLVVLLRNAVRLRLCCDIPYLRNQAGGIFREGLS